MRRLVIAMLALLAACTAGGSAPRSGPAPPVSPLPSASPLPSPSASPSFDPGPSTFDAGRAFRTVVALAEGIGPREDTDPGFRRAVDLIAKSFETMGYSVTRQSFPVPSGTSAGTAVPAGTSVNVIAEPPDFDPSAPHLLAGAHLDTVPRSPGANDNASGVALVVELARLARVTSTAMPVVFVAFGGEERRRRGNEGILIGSRHYLRTMDSQRRAALRGVLVADVVGRGSLRVCSGGQTPKTMIRAMVAGAARAGVSARECVYRQQASDHAPFEVAGMTVAWLYTGDFSQLHTRRDTVAIVRKADLGAAGRAAWEGLRSLRL